jgi:glutamate-5-semialdehyde dehydrogenase
MAEITETYRKEKEIIAGLKKVRRAARRIPALGDQAIAGILNTLADRTLAQSEQLLAENRKDLERMDEDNPKYDRLMLTPGRLEGIARDLRKVAELPSPLNHVLEERSLPNGLQLQKVSVPLGVIGIVYESRPNVTFDVFALCLKSANATVLKGSRDAHYSNLAIIALIKGVLRSFDLEEAVYLAPSEREALSPILQAGECLDLIIPRGGKGLIDFVRANATVPVIETGAGIVHNYYDKSADFEKGKAIVENAKTRRVSVCNALDTLVIHRDRLADLPKLVADLGGRHRVQIFADEPAYLVIKEFYPGNLLAPAGEEHFGTEFLSLKMSIKTVSDIEEAVEHIGRYSSRHSEAIIAEDPEAIEYFFQNVDAAVVYANASTAFTDGAQFGMGAEIGISTQKLHARGPMALRELTSYKWLIRGHGQIRPKS